MELAGSSSQSAYRLHAITGTFFIPASAPSNPFEQDITVNVPITGGHDTYDSRSGSYRALLGAVLEVGRSWRAEFDVTFDRNDMRQAFPSGRLLSSANSAVLTGAIDVFKDINAFPVDFASHMPPASSISPTHSTQRGAAARFSGPFFDLPGGSATLSVVLEGFENEYGDFEQVTYGLGGVPTRLLYSGRSSSNGSTYLEVRLPLVSESNRIRGMDLLELQLAGRYDHYELKAGSLTRDGSDDSPSHVGFREDSVEPTVGVRFRPFLGLTFRASYATGFVPPDIVHLMPLLSSTQIGFFLTDPKRGDEFLGNVVVHRGGRNDIKPERSISKSAGMIIAPPWLPGLRVSFDWTKIEKRDNIISLGLDQDTINNEDRLPGVIIRELPPPGDPYGVGRIVELDGRYRNGTWAKSESYDFSIEYEYPTEGLGTWTFHGAATKLLHSVQQAVPFFPPTEYAGTFAAPEWSANATLAWNRGPLGASWTTRYLDDYWLFTNHEHYAAQGGAKVGAATYHDIAVRYQTGEESKATLFSNISVRAGIRNVLNRKPRFYAVSSTMYDPWSDPRMATYYVTISKRF